MVNTTITPGPAQEAVSPSLPRIGHTHMLPPPPRKVSGHVRRDGDDYAQGLANLLPTGIAWPREPESLLMRVVSGLAQYWGTVDGRAADLLEIESDPRTTREMLDDWERNYGLPYPTLEHQIDVLRRRLLVHHITLEGSPSRQFFIDTAAYFGFTISITEYSNFTCGKSRCGDTRHLNPDDPKRYRWEIGPIFNRFVWRVTALNSAAPLIGYLFSRFQPAHTAVVFTYYAVSPDISPAHADLSLSRSASDLSFAILSPHISPPSYAMSFLGYPPDAVLITRNKIIDSVNIVLTTSPPTAEHGRARLPGQANLALSPTAPSVVKT